MFEDYCIAVVEELHRSLSPVEMFTVFEKYNAGWTVQELVDLLKK